MKVYWDNVIASGAARGDLPPQEMAVLARLSQDPCRGRVEVVTSRESWREQERASDESVRATLEQARSDVPLVERDHEVRGFSELQDQLGGFVTIPLVTDIVDEQLFAALQAQRLKAADARHLMYAVSNGCERFVTMDPDFINVRASLEPLCRGLRIVTLAELAQDLGC